MRMYVAVFRVFLTIITFFLLLSMQTMRADTVSNHIDTVRTQLDTVDGAILDVNGDCIADTLTYITYSTGVVDWKDIRWGARYGVGLCDTAYFSMVSYIPQSVSVITAPSWYHRSVSINIVNRNSTDTLPDLMVDVFGSTIKSNIVSGDTILFLKDTSLSFTIYAQRGLDSLPVINLSTISDGMTSPFSADKIVRGRDLLDSQVVARAPIVVYQSVSTSRNVALRDELLIGKKVVSGTDKDRKINLQLTPNPATASTTLHVSGLSPEGRYRVRVIDRIGKVLLEQLASSNDVQLHMILDTKPLSSGTYSVNVMLGETILGTTQLAVIK